MIPTKGESLVPPSQIPASTTVASDAANSTFQMLQKQTKKTDKNRHNRREMCNVTKLGGHDVF
jgi:hypothetical protein